MYNLVKASFGMLDELRIYNYALTPDEVKTLYGMKDGIEVVSSNKILAKATINSGADVQLQVNLLIHSYTSPDKTLPFGKEELKRLNVTANAGYKSDNEKIVKVSKEGLVTTDGKDKAMIIVTYGRYSRKIRITVK